MTPLDAVEYVRKKRRGAFNSKQITYLDTYKPERTKKSTLRRSISRLFGGSRPSTPQPTAGSASSAAVAQS